MRCSRIRRWAASAMTEAEAFKAGHKILVGRARYGETAMGYAMGEESGFAKIVVEKGTGKVLGCTIVGPDASILIQQAVLLMNTETQTLAPFERSQVIHPALSELLSRAIETLKARTCYPWAGSYVKCLLRDDHVMILAYAFYGIDDKASFCDQLSGLRFVEPLLERRPHAHGLFLPVHVDQLSALFQHVASIMQDFCRVIEVVQADAEKYDVCAAFANDSVLRRAGLRLYVRKPFFRCFLA